MTETKSGVVMMWRPCDARFLENLSSDHIGHRRLDALKVDVSDGKQREGDQCGDCQQAKVRRHSLQHDAAKILYHSDHRIENIKAPKTFGHGGERVHDRRGEHPDLREQRNRHADVAKAHLRRRENERGGRGEQQQDAGNGNDVDEIDAERHSIVEHQADKHRRSHEQVKER